MDHFPPERERLDEIKWTIYQKFGIEINEAQPIHRGWLNNKWKLSTSRGNLFVKQYHSQRYRLHEPDKLELVLRMQNELHESGFPCPRIFSNDGQHVLSSVQGTRFVLTQFCQGDVIDPGTANESQMADLGRITGMMHTLLNHDEARRSGQLAWRPPTRENLLALWRKNWDNAQVQTCPDGLLAALEMQGEIIQGLDMTEFAVCEPGWMHWDLWVDNILFQNDRVAAVIDFDRMRWLYPEMDVARALLSCTLDVERGEMDGALVQAFMEGYRSTYRFTRGGLPRAFRLLWCLEATNWMVHDMDMYSAPPARFARENMWLTTYWVEMDDLFGDI